MSNKSLTATELRNILFGNQFKGKKARNVFHACTSLMDAVGSEVYIASNNLNWLLNTGRLNPGYVFALREGSAKTVCEAILGLIGVSEEVNMIKAVESSIKPIKL